MRLRLLVMGALVAALAGSACSDPEVHQASSDPLPPVGEREPGDPEVQATGGPMVIETSNYLVAPGAAQTVVDDITRELGPLLVTSFDLYDRYAIFEAQDPGKPDNLDRYIYRDGALGDPEPVHVDQTVLDELPNRLFSLSDVNWNAVSTVAEVAMVQLQIEDAEVNHLGVDRSHDSGAVELSLSVSGPRRSGSVEATADGTVTEARVY
ncbi:MAG: hypothetical protein ACRDY4_05805 [Acidimicrobiia bacterium]